ncbi:rhodanese-like domain-containing protein [Arthrobacter sp. NQ4]|uniref:rhodanese-like domain-containing protein n=1 Tax=Arthrobacter sp. NQ4 TaxID=3027930 RepID=UPI0023B12D41|nr:rhodanese-like domain-containing protein [Arthrobacter sp. NQ4]MDE8586003.1 rhodanese-like domain-containing protein [Arthrobacter sp. NQ4]
MTDQRAFRTVTADELALARPRVTLVDVRSREEHATAHVPGSLNIPLDELASRLTDLPNTTLYLMCGSGKRSSQAARVLTDRGHTAVNVAGGITEWYRAGHPVSYSQTPADQPAPSKNPAAPGLRRLLPRLFRRTSA